MSMKVGGSDHLSFDGRRLVMPSGFTVSEASPDDGDVTMSNGGSITPVFNLKNYGAALDGLTDDSAAVAAAVAALNAAGEGVLYNPGGVCKTGGGYAITVPCELIGVGRGSAGAGNYGSVFTLGNGANADLFTFSGKFPTIRNLGFDGNYANQSATSRALVAAAGAAYGIAEGLYIANFHDDGLSLAASGWHIAQTEIRACQGHGINVLSGCPDSDITSVNIGSCGLSGLKVASSDISCAQLHSWGNGTLGTNNDREGVLLVTGAGAFRLVNSYLETNQSAGLRLLNGNINGVIVSGSNFWKNQGQGCYAFTAVNLAFTGNTVFDNGRNGSAGSNAAGLVNDSGSYWTVTGNQFFDDGSGGREQTYAYYEVNTADHNTIFGNVMPAALHKTGSNVITGANNTPPAASMGTYNQV